MVSRYEVMEYLRLKPNRTDSFQNIVRFFKRNGNCNGIGFVVRELHRMGYLQKLIKYRKISTNPNIDDQIFFKEKTNEAKIYPVWLRLTDRAMKLLEIHGVKSFYDLPRARFIEENMKRRRNKRLRRGFVRIQNV